MCMFLPIYVNHVSNFWQAGMIHVSWEAINEMLLILSFDKL